ncbi:MAG: hypothetical protein P1U34_08700 [Coxiellaceae bacterium]|nr:hypothetical protein [Coxiellaceae bacterium]
MRHLIEVRTHNAWAHTSIAEMAYNSQLSANLEHIKQVQAISAGSPANGDIIQQITEEILQLVDVESPSDQVVTLNYPKVNPWLFIHYKPVAKAADNEAKMFVFDKVVSLREELTQQQNDTLEDFAKHVEYIMLQVNSARHYTLLPNHKQLEKDKSKVDRVTLPTVEAGFAYGLSTKGFTSYLQQPSAQSFSLLNNNCADHVSRVLNFCQTQANNHKITNQLRQAEKATHSLLGVSNPNVRLPWGKTTKSYAKAIRQHILQATINDAKALLSSAEKTRQVIEIEMLRLQDGIHNIKNSCISALRQQSLVMKYGKLNALRQYLQAMDEKSDALMISELAELCNNPDINAGTTRHKTVDHLRELLAAVQPQPEYEPTPQGMTV